VELNQPNTATPAREPAPGSAPHAAWPLAIVLSLALGVVFRLTAWHSMGTTFLPGYVWGPAAGVAILLYLWLARGRLPAAGTRDGETASPEPTQVAWAALVIAGFVTNALTFAPERLGALALLNAIHLPVLTWLVMGVAVLGRADDPMERFAAVVKSIEVLVTGAIYAGVVAIFSGVTVGLLTALQVKLPPQVIQATFAFLLGLVPVLAVASVYDPGLRPAAQRFGAGVTRIFFIVARLFLPLTLLVLLLVAVLLPMRFGVLSEDRGTLLIFNAMLFAVMLLIVGATPLRTDDLAPRAGAWLRRGIAALAFAATVVGAYALAAVLSRTAQGGLTPNRLTVIGWNVVNLVTLLLLLLRQLRAGREGWVRALHVAFGQGLALYALWSAFVLVALPHLARVAHWPVSAGHGLGD
jgi:hypothetical protein